MMPSSGSNWIGDMGGGRRGSDHPSPGISPLNPFTVSCAAGSADEAASSSFDLSFSDLSPSVSYSETNPGDHPNLATDPKPADDESQRRRYMTYLDIFESYVTPFRTAPDALQAAKDIITR